MPGDSLSAAALRGRIGAYRLHASHDPRETTANARAAFLGRFVDEVDPDRSLTEAERLRRATAARKAHFAKLAYQSSVSRAKKAAPVRSESGATEQEGHGNDRPAR